MNVDGQIATFNKVYPTIAKTQSLLFFYLVFTLTLTTMKLLPSLQLYFSNRFIALIRVYRSDLSGHTASIITSFYFWWTPHTPISSKHNTTDHREPLCLVDVPFQVDRGECVRC